MGDGPHMPLRISAHNTVVVERRARTGERGFLENQRKISGTSSEIFIVQASITKRPLRNKGYDIGSAEASHTGTQCNRFDRLIS